MIAKWFGELVLRRRSNAILVALLCSLIPLTNWLAMVTVVIVMLAKGAGEGLLILLWALLPVIVLGISGHYWFLVIIEVLGNGLVLWLLTYTYRKTKRWEYIISLAVIIGLGFVFMIHLFIHDPANWMTTNLNHMMSNEGLDVNSNRLIGLQVIKPFLVGINITFALLIVLLELICGAAVYAVLTHDKHFGAGLRSIRLHYGSVFILLISVLLAVVGPPLFCSLLMIIMFPFFIAGVSLIHGVIIQKKWPPFVLLTLYLLFFIVLLFFPPLLAVVVLLAVADSFANFRQLKWFK